MVIFFRLCPHLISKRSSFFLPVIFLRISYFQYHRSFPVKDRIFLPTTSPPLIRYALSYRIVGWQICTGTIRTVVSPDLYRVMELLIINNSMFIINVKIYEHPNIPGWFPSRSFSNLTVLSLAVSPFAHYYIQDHPSHLWFAHHSCWNSGRTVSPDSPHILL